MAPDGVVFGVLLGRICMAQVAHKYMGSKQPDQTRQYSIRATETTAEKLSSFFSSASFLASQGWILDGHPQLAVGSQDWISLSLSHALFLLRLLLDGT